MKKNSTINGIRKFILFTLLRGPYYLLYVLTTAFMVCIFLLPGRETLTMLNIAFPVVAIVTGISFSWTQCLPGGAVKRMAYHAARRFFHSLILIFLSILLKYVSIAPIPDTLRPKALLVVLDGLGFCTAGAALLFFFGGMHVVACRLLVDEREETADREVKKP